MKNKPASHFIKIVLIIGVIAIPLAYSLFYLGAFWDPYGRLNQLPVALVNDDSGAVISGHERNLGNELVAELEKDNALKWVDTDAQGASSGLNGTAYYAVITIPKDFSASVSSAEKVEKKQATITYSANEKKNFLAAQILNRAVLQLQDQLQAKIDKEITAQLTSQLNAVPAQLQDLSTGLGALSDGAATLQQGVSDLSSGQRQVSSGTDQLDMGLSQLVDGSQSLSANIGQLQSGLAQVARSVDGAVTSLNSTAGQTTTVTEKMQMLSQGAQKLKLGLAQASAGAGQLNDALSSTDSGVPALNSGIEQVSSGAQKLNEGIKAYVDGVDVVLTQNKTMLAQLETISTSTSMTDAQKQVAIEKVLQAAASGSTESALAALRKSGADLETGAQKLAIGTIGLQAAEPAMTKAQAGVAALSGSLKALAEGGAQVADGVDELQSKSASLTGLTDKLSALSGALGQLDGGAAKLYMGAQQLTEGLQSAKAGSSKLVNGSAQLADGSAQLQAGFSKLSEGVTTAKDAVDTSVQKAQTDLKVTDGLADLAAAPVHISENPTNPVPNYGTAFAPYFISLSLYVGAIIMFVGIYLDADKKIPTLSRDSGRRYLRVGVFALIGVVQAIALALIVRYGLGIKLDNPIAYYLSCILVSMVFIAIVEFFMVCLKDVGKFLTLLLLILQLTSCGGTFPMETVPGFFRALYPFMPMTYSVNLFKETISGFDGGAATSSAVILLVIGASFTLLTMLFTAGKRAKSRRFNTRLVQDTAD